MFAPWSDDPAERAIRARRNGKEARFDHVLDRALELFDLTAADDRWRGHRRREILRAREEFCRPSMRASEASVP
jgi:hypothetical protein